MRRASARIGAEHRCSPSASRIRMSGSLGAPVVAADPAPIGERDPGVAVGAPPRWTARRDCRCSHIAGCARSVHFVMARAPLGTTDPGTGVQSTFDRSRLLHQRKSEASIADSVSVRVPPSCAAEFVEVPALRGAALALPGCASASLETNITWLTDTPRAAGTASPARRRGAARSPRRELRTPPARAVPAPTANSQPSPSV